MTYVSAEHLQRVSHSHRTHRDCPGWLEDFAASTSRKWSVINSGVEGSAGLFLRFQSSFRVGVYVEPKSILAGMLEGIRAYEHSTRRSAEPYSRRKKVDYEYNVVIHLHAISSGVRQIDYETTEDIDPMHHSFDELGRHFAASALGDGRGPIGDQFFNLRSEPRRAGLIIPYNRRVGNSSAT